MSDQIYNSHLIPPGLLRLPRPTWHGAEGGISADADPLTLDKMREAMARLGPPPPIVPGLLDRSLSDIWRKTEDDIACSVGVPSNLMVSTRGSDPYDWSINLKPEALLDEPPFDPLREFFRIRIYVSSAVPKDKVYAIMLRHGMPQLHASASMADAIVAAGVNCVVIDNRPWAEQEHERIWRDVRRDIARECPTIAPAWWGRS